MHYFTNILFQVLIIVILHFICREVLNGFLELHQALSSAVVVVFLMLKLQVIIKNKMSIQPQVAEG